MQTSKKAGRTLTRAELKKVSGGKAAKFFLCGPRCTTVTGAIKCSSLGCSCDANNDCILE